MKSMFMHKIINDNADLNLKQSFRLYSEGDSLNDIRNQANDSKSKRNLGKRSF